MVTAYLSIGSNLADPESQCQNAVAALDSSPGLSVTRVSPLYRTRPVEEPDQPWFVNAVVEVRTSMVASGLLAVCRDIENRMGRVREYRFGPRVIDIDILMFGDECVEIPDLVVPHPRMTARRFVLVPLCDMVPDLRHPASGRTMAWLLEQIPEEDQEVFPCDT